MFDRGLQIVAVSSCGKHRRDFFGGSPIDEPVRGATPRRQVEGNSVHGVGCSHAFAASNEVAPRRPSKGTKCRGLGMPSANAAFRRGRGVAPSRTASPD